MYELQFSISYYLTFFGVWNLKLLVNLLVPQMSNQNELNLAVSHLHLTSCMPSGRAPKNHNRNIIECKMVKLK